MTTYSFKMFTKCFLYVPSTVPGTDDMMERTKFLLLKIIQSLGGKSDN